MVVRVLLLKETTRLGDVGVVRSWLAAGDLVNDAVGGPHAVAANSFMLRKLD